MNKKTFALILSMAIILIASQAFADSIGPDCPSCYGNIFTLSYSEIGADLYRITLNIDTAGFMAKTADEYLNSVSIKIASQDGFYLSEATVSAPSGWKSSLSLEKNGFLTDTNAGTPFYLSDGFLTFTWDIGIKSGALFTGSMEASIKAEYLRNGGKQQRYTSENITLQAENIPEPGMLILLSLGLAATAIAARRQLLRQTARSSQQSNSRL